MKKVIATIEVFHIDHVKEALITIGVSGMTVYHVNAYATRYERTESERGAPYIIDYIPELVVEVVVDDFKVEQVVHTIRQATRGRRGCDGVITILPVDEAIRLRTGERGSSAL
jgi:nitrogen regulatory protein P-II 1